MHDVLPSQSPAWQRLEAIIRDVFAGSAYSEIRMPLVEPTELFQRSIGEVTDIVEKEMYTFTDRSGVSLSLRPEGTASCMRALVEHGLLDGRQLRLWYMGPMFRHERPQKGRYRQFHQAGCETYGMPGPDIEAELIAMTARLWRRLGLDGLRLEINSLGDAASRATYRAELVSYFERHADQLDEDSRRRLTTNPLRILDTKNPAMKELVAGAPRLLDNLGDEARAHFEGLQQRLGWLGITATVNPRLVRGLDYYCHSVFEWVSDDLGAQGTVCAGGRYDGLSEHLGAKPMPAVGFAMGIERLLALLESRQGVLAENPPHAYVVMAGDAAEEAGLRLVERLRDAEPDLRLMANCGGGGFKAQMKRADRSGAPLALILGEDEVAAGTVILKPLRGGEGQQAISRDTLQPQQILQASGDRHG